MNQTQVNNFLRCLVQIDDLNYLILHSRAAALNGNDAVAHRDGDHDHDHDHIHAADDDDDGAQSSSHDLLVAKVTAMLVLFCASALCGCIPFVLNRFFRWTESHANARSAIVVKCLLYFGGGVLLATTFLHLLPEVQETIEQLQECGILPQLTFALAELLMCAGFFLMYFIEEVLHACIRRHQRLLDKDAGAGAAFERGQSVRRSYLARGSRAVDGTAPDDNTQTQTTSASAKELPSPAVIGTLSVQQLVAHDAENEKYQTIEVDKTPTHSPNHDFKYDAQKPHAHAHTNTAYHGYNHGHSHSHSHSHSHAHLHSHNGTDDVITSSLRGFFIVLALSLHELFEGMAIGLEGNASAVWFMFGAVSAHKLVLAFCVGVELIVARTRTSLCVVYILTFAVVSPIGIGIGILISHSEDVATPTIPSAILQGLACGTLLYVVFFEILSKNHAGLFAYLALFVGFAIMFGLQQLGADGHGHSHGGCAGSSHTHTHDHDETRELLLPGEHQTNQNQPQLHHQHQHQHQHAYAHEHQHDDTATVFHDTNSFAHELQILRQASQELMQNSPQTD